MLQERTRRKKKKKVLVDVKKTRKKRGLKFTGCLFVNTKTHFDEGPEEDRRT